MTDPADLGAVAARRLIGARALSPVELAEACIARVEAVNHAVNAVVAQDVEGLRAAARAAEAAVMAGDPLGPLHGLPVAIKDERDVAGLPTTHGSLLCADHVASADDDLLAGLRAAGALILGKTNVPEWSKGANTRNRLHGVTANPHDPTRSAAGSSGGSAVALACGMAPLATGSDLGGSLRNPAAWCGVTGMRPSMGLVPDAMREMGLLPLSTDGPMARSPEDAALLLSVLARPEPRDPWAWRAAPDGLAPLVPQDLSDLRVAVTEDFGFAPTERLIRDTLRDRVARLAGHFGAVEEASPDCSGADRIFSVLRGVLFLGRLRAMAADHGPRIGANVRANVAEAEGYGATDVAEAMALQAAFHRAWTAFFAHHDILLCPAVTVSPRPWAELYPAEIDGRPTRSYYHWLALAYAVTIAGHPAVSIPCGLDGARLPFGLQIVGRRGEDARLLAIAQALSGIIAADPALRPCPPDLSALAAAPPIAAAEGFRDL